ncbi:metal-dependent hydrolase [Ideonella sp. BN130291]|uniref:metal-dependent hydrolase n=1 Tax=Ideonella sp. BN130291 TaxID=3112940 RepID=UPI002E2629ED|nr:metal-dependent hydrolase [Ideonella sp. BN130291]
MPTILAHAAVPLALGLGLGRGVVPRRLLIAGVMASAVPDLDVLAFRFGVPYADAWGHRGASHSLAFALLLGAVAWLGARALQATPRTAFLFIAIATASHGLLDMLTNGGQGVALWWPLSSERLFFPWQVIEASPLSLRRLAGGRGLQVLVSELLWVWAAAVAVMLTLRLVRRRRGNGSSTHDGDR